MGTIAVVCLLVVLWRTGAVAVPRCPGVARPVEAALEATTGAALWLIALSVLASRLPLGLAAVAALVAALAAAVVMRTVARAATPAPTAGPGAGGDRYGRTLELLVAGLFGLIASRGYFYDELDHHLPLANAILRGSYPPAYPFLPAAPFRYYLGFNLASASLARIGDWATTTAFDVVTVLAVLGVARFAWGLASTAGVPGGAALTTVLVFFGGGLAWLKYPVDAFRLAHPDLPSVFALPFYHLEYQPWQIPPIAGYLFQHPMALGLPFFLAILWVSVTASVRPAPSVVLLGGALLGALGLSQTLLLYFAIPVALVAPVIAAAACDDSSHTSGGRRCRVTGLALACGAVALGLVVYAAAGAGGAVAPRAGLLALRWPPGLGWGGRWTFPGYLESFGLPLFMGIGGFVLAWRRRWGSGMLASVVFGLGFSAPHLVEIRQNPWDTAKLFVPASLAAAVAAGPALAALLARFGARGRRRMRAVLLGASCLSPLLFLFVRALGPLGIDASLPPIPAVLFPPPAGGIDREVAAWLVTVARRGDVVLTIGPYVTAHSGVPSFAPQPDVWAWARSLDPDGAYRRDLERLWSELDPEQVRRYRIAWVVVGPAEQARLGPRARERLRDPTLFERVKRFERAGHERLVYRANGSAPGR